MNVINSEKTLNILELLRTGKEAIDYIITNNQSGNIREAIQLLPDIIDLINSVQRAVESLEDEIPLSRISEIVKNLASHIESIVPLLAEENDGFMDFEIRLLLPALYGLLTNEVAFIVENFVDKSLYTDFYPETLPVNREEVIDEMKQSDSYVSLVLLAYNKLDYTKQCMESILKYTKNCDFELILVNNGSSDGTKEYFDSFPSAKKIHLKYNIGATLGFNIGMMVAEGRYVAALGNDIIFTHNWLSNLINCIESDNSFGYVAPAATYMSNFQQIDVKFEEIEEFHEFSKKYNVSDPLMWEERIVLMPTVLLIPTPLMKRINYFDARYYYGEFADDDISFKVRRSGFKCIYCKDTVIHHYGHVTVGDDQRTNQSLEVSRMIFKEKYGIDAWEDARLDLDLVNMADFTAEIKSILGIDVKCGGTPVQIKNFLKNRGQDTELSVFTTEEKFCLDLKTICGDVVFDEEIKNLSNYYKINQFDMILIEKPLDEYDEVSLNKIFVMLKSHLKKGGQLVLKINNPSFYRNLYNLLQGNSLDGEGTKLYTTSLILKNISEIGFSRIHVSSLMVSDNTLFSDKIAGIFQGNEIQNKTKEILLTKEILYRIS